jgi:hypothetical protein
MDTPIIGRAVRREDVVRAWLQRRAVDRRPGHVRRLAFQHDPCLRVPREPGGRGELVVHVVIAIHVVRIASATEVVRIVVVGDSAIGRSRDGEDLAGGERRHERAAAEAEDVAAVEEDGRIEVGPRDSLRIAADNVGVAAVARLIEPAGADEIARGVDVRAGIRFQPQRKTTRHAARRGPLHARGLGRREQVHHQHQRRGRDDTHARWPESAKGLERRLQGESIHMGGSVSLVPSAHTCRTVAVFQP